MGELPPYGEAGYGELVPGDDTTMTRTAAVTLTLTEQGELIATVNDDGGNPVPNADVAISGSVEEADVTDDTGTVTFGAI